MVADTLVIVDGRLGYVVQKDSICEDLSSPYMALCFVLQIRDENVDSKTDVPGRSGVWS